MEWKKIKVYIKDRKTLKEKYYNFYPREREREVRESKNFHFFICKSFFYCFSQFHFIFNSVKLFKTSLIMQSKRMSVCPFICRERSCIQLGWGEYTFQSTSLMVWTWFLLISIFLPINLFDLDTKSSIFTSSFTPSI